MVLIWSMDISKTPDFDEYVRNISGFSQGYSDYGFIYLQNFFGVFTSSAVETVNILAWFAYGVTLLGAFLLSRGSALPVFLVATNSALYAFIHIRATLAIGCMLIGLSYCWCKEPRRNTKLLCWSAYGIGMSIHSVLVYFLPFFLYLAAPLDESEVLKRTKIRKRWQKFEPLPQILFLALVAISSYVIVNLIFSNININTLLSAYSFLPKSVFDYIAYKGAVISADQTTLFVAFGILRCVIGIIISNQIVKFSRNGVLNALDPRSSYGLVLLCRIQPLMYIAPLFIAGFAGQEGFTRIVSVLNPIFDVAIGIGIIELVKSSKDLLNAALLLFLVVLLVVTFSARLIWIASYFG